MTTVLVTGATGFIGSRLVLELLQTSRDVTVFGCARSLVNDDMGIALFRGDLTHESFAQEVVDRSQPDVVYHLAGLTSGSLTQLLDANVVATQRLATALQRTAGRPRLALVGSAAVYGQGGQCPEAIAETTPY